MRDPSHVTYTTAHSNTGSSTHWMRPGIELVSSWMLVRFANCWATIGTPKGNSCLIYSRSSKQMFSLINNLYPYFQLQHAGFRKKKYIFLKAFVCKKPKGGVYFPVWTEITMSLTCISLRWCWPITPSSAYVLNIKEFTTQMLKELCNTPQKVIIPSVSNCYHHKREYTEELNLCLLSSSPEKQKLEIMWNGSIFWHTTRFLIPPVER